MDTRWPLLLLLVLFWACSSDKSDDLFIDCRYSAPESIFSNALPDVEQHSFFLDKMVGEESLAFADGSSLRLRQSGCDYLKQEFEFAAPSFDRQKSIAFWFEESIDLLHRVSEMGPEYISYRQWAKAMEKKVRSFELDKTVMLADGFYAKVSRQNSRGAAILLLTLSEKP
ncbi:MAG: hypothetical protein KTR30_02745 [Saprospiraceae bacterium]|nr:hypothetical protein [Saprospiraceae bacterium]